MRFFPANAVTVAPQTGRARRVRMGITGKGESGTGVGAHS